LAVGHAGSFWIFIAKNVILELVHSRIGKHEGWVVFDNDRRGGNIDVAFGLEKIDEQTSDFLCFHLSFFLMIGFSIIYITLQTPGFDHPPFNPFGAQN
jgi:hypothetical protein